MLGIVDILRILGILGILGIVGIIGILGILCILDIGYRHRYRYSSGYRYGSDKYWVLKVQWSQSYPFHFKHNPNFIAMYQFV